MKSQFDLDESLELVKQGARIDGKDGILVPLIKQLTEAALEAEIESKWGQKYPIVIQSWRNKWEHLSAYFKYSEDIRRMIYTTNIIESVDNFI